MDINAQGLDFTVLNARVKAAADGEIRIRNAMGQRYIGSGVRDKHITVSGVPGNALGAYLHSCSVTVYGSAQDAVGDTMNDGRIVVHGSVGDTVGYAMRGGRIFVEGNAGYRVGIHMKEYGETIPAIVVGGRTGDFLGEYQAGGIILVLGIGCKGNLVGNFTGTGMHGGRIYVRGDDVPNDLPPQVTVTRKTDRTAILPLVEEFCGYFSADRDALLKSEYYLLAPSDKNLYRTLYCNRSK